MCEDSAGEQKVKIVLAYNSISCQEDFISSTRDNIYGEILSFQTVADVQRWVLEFIYRNMLWMLWIMDLLQRESVKGIHYNWEPFLKHHSVSDFYLE